ncbi:MAG: c-type cytochrome domain-containing protein [Bacteroidota bacterium]|nr:c-type cytochrome domain-containing protein [Bacteroidota bacterium]
MLASIIEFIAHFHPVLVHLPIGFLLAGLLLQWLSGKDKYVSLRPAIPVILLGGAVGATISCITGYLLSVSDDYDLVLINWHQWMGISVGIISWFVWLKQRNSGKPFSKTILSVVLFLLILVTGHLGGSLTHGSDYLTKPLGDIFKGDSIPATVIKPLPDVQEALIYENIVRPILQTKCYSCHGANKQKGKLRMDDTLMLMKGGKDGKVIISGNAGNSEIIKRLLLPVDNEGHMSPKEKPQPSENQVALLYWWINNGASFTKKVKETDQPDRIKPVLLALQNEPEVKSAVTSIPAKPVKKADDKMMEQLKRKGIVVLPVAQNSNYLMADFISDTLITNDDLRLLLSLKEQLIWLKIGNTNLNDTDMTLISQLHNLTRLSIEHTVISDKGIIQLKSLQKLQYLNLVGTRVTAAGVLQLKEIKTLLSLFLYQTNVSKADWPALQNAFPKTQVDSGGYSLETLPTDTMEVKAKK